MAFDLDEHLVFDADPPRQLAPTLGRIRVLDQLCGLPVAAGGHQHRVGVDIALDAILVEDVLNVQCLQDLTQDGALVLKLQRQVFTQLQALLPSMRDGIELAVLADFGAGLQRE